MNVHNSVYACAKVKVEEEEEEEEKKTVFYFLMQGPQRGGGGRNSFIPLREEACNFNYTTKITIFVSMLNLKQYFRLR